MNCVVEARFGGEFAPNHAFSCAPRWLLLSDCRMRLIFSIYCALLQISSSKQPIISSESCFSPCESYFGKSFLCVKTQHSFSRFRIILCRIILPRVYCMIIVKKTLTRSGIVSDLFESNRCSKLLYELSKVIRTPWENQFQSLNYVK